MERVPWCVYNCKVNLLSFNLLVEMGMSEWFWLENVRFVLYQKFLSRHWIVFVTGPPLMPIVLRISLSSQINVYNMEWDWPCYLVILVALHLVSSYCFLWWLMLYSSCYWHFWARLTRTLPKGLYYYLFCFSFARFAN